jgi:predicted Zn-ribbon and HTH transcriptional regulator
MPVHERAKPKEDVQEEEVCKDCGYPLSRKESKRRGYGPKCAKRNGWPYDFNAD